MGAKKIDIDWKRVGQYLNAQCSGVSIASIMGIHENTLYERCKKDLGMEFMAYSAIKKGDGIELLRAKQFDLAMNGDRTLLIWLGKQLLGQKEQIEQTITVPQISVHTLNETEQAEISTALVALEEHESNKSIQEEPDSDNEQ